MLVNTIGHSAGCLIFGIFLYLFLRDVRGARLGRSILPAIAAVLALLWNVGSLVVLATVAAGGEGESWAAALSFSVLSLLPAVLLQMSLRGRIPTISALGYALSTAAVALHVAELFVPGLRLHESALLLISVGFGALTLASVLMPGRVEDARRPMRALVGMALFLLATSFVHFGEAHSNHLWSEEIALHHAGIPLALFVLSQEHRFLLLDAFVRFLANAFLAAGLIGCAVALDARLHVVRYAAENSFFKGLLIVGACVGLILFAQFRSAVQGWITRVVFRRLALSSTLQSLTSGSEEAESEGEFLARAAHKVAEYVGTDRYELRPATRQQSEGMLLPQPVGRGAALAPEELDKWVEAVVPLRFSRGDVLLMLLGRRAGGRRYLSEDLISLAQLALVIGGQVERFRAGELQRLAAEAELRALQAQINPHFLFNALNALYGAIPRQAAGARNTVLNLAEIFRYFLQTEKTFIPLEDELRIVSAYLEIEKLRLGERLQTVIDVDNNARAVRIPALSIQPIVENAVKHGVAGKEGPGKVRVGIHCEFGHLKIEVEDSGGSFDPMSDRSSRGSGVGLENVRQRLRLCYGSAAELTISVKPGSTLVSVQLPRAGQAARSGRSRDREEAEGIRGEMR